MAAQQVQDVPGQRIPPIGFERGKYLVRRTVATLEDLQPVLGRPVAQHEGFRPDLQGMPWKQIPQHGLGAPSGGRAQAGRRRRGIAADQPQQLADEALGRPVRQADASSGHDNARQLRGRPLLIRGEHDAKGGKRHIVAAVVERQRFGIGLAKRYGKALRIGPLLATREQRRHIVRGSDPRKTARRRQGGIPIAGRHVEHPAAGAQLDRLAKFFANDLQRAADHRIVARSPYGMLALLDGLVVRDESFSGHGILLPEDGSTGASAAESRRDPLPRRFPSWTRRTRGTSSISEPQPGLLRSTLAWSWPPSTEANMTRDSYQQFCPVAMAAEVLCRRWTLLLLRELLSGSARFNALRRGLPRMSTALLAKRLRELETAGILVRSPVSAEAGVCEYHLTAAGRELRPIVETMGVWGQRWVAAEASLHHLDADLLMWDVRRRIDVSSMPERRSTIQFIFPERPARERCYWLIAEQGQEADLCTFDPGYEVDLYVRADLRTLTEIWLGHTSIARARTAGRLALTGSRQLARTFDAWFALSPFAAVQPPQAQALP